MMHKLLSLVLVLALVQPGLAQTQPQSEVIPRQTEVEIELVENVSSETLHAGQSVSFKIVRPVAVSGTTVMPAGLAVSGEIRAVRPSGAWHKAGTFNLVLKPIRLTDGSTVQLDFHRPELVGTKGEKTGAAIGAPLALTYLFVLIPAFLVGAARKGEPYTIRAGER